MGFGVGEQVGPYEITDYLGQGGMATIYKARQTSLDRFVAIKVIHPALKDDQAFLERLNREAAIVAKLNHPNIVPVYDFGECDGIPYLVMRYIDGRTLKSVMQESRLDTKRIMSITRSIADALQYAHEHSVLHRDVKPSNVLLDAEGNVFLTDFGLARMVQSSETTLSRDMLIGSPLYISPEQARSESVDERSDVYSFGVILYEMFTGRVPFSGDTPYATIMAQINDPLPAPRDIDPTIPLAVEIVLQKALAKNREDRYSSANELIKALENALNGPQETNETEAIPIIENPFVSSAESVQEAKPVPQARTRQVTTPDVQETEAAPLIRWIPIAIGAMALVVVAASIVLFGSRIPVPGFLAEAERTQTATPTSAFSFSAALATTQAVDTPTAAILATIAPRPSTVSIVPTVAPVLPIEGFRGKIVYSVTRGELPEQHTAWLVDVGTAKPRKILDYAVWPSLSPDGKQVAYYRIRESGIYIAKSDGTNPKRILEYADTCCVQWSPDGKRIVFFRGKLNSGGAILLADADGSDVVELTRGYNPTFSPDGNRIAYSNCQANTSQCGLFIYDIKAKSSSMITRDNGSSPQWSPRGDRLVYQADDGKGHINVFAVNTDGKGARQLTSGKSNDGQPTFSRDGSYILWRSDRNGAGWAIFAMESDGTNPRLIVNDTPVSVYWGRESLSTSP